MRSPQRKRPRKRRIYVYKGYPLDKDEWPEGIEAIHAAA